MRALFVLGSHGSTWGASDGQANVHAISGREVHLWEVPKLGTDGKNEMGVYGLLRTSSP